MMRQTGNTKSHQDRLWIGGSPCSGKSSIARWLAKRYGIAVYQCDAHWDDHIRVADSATEPALHSVTTMSWDDLWMRDVATLVEHERALYREEFAMIIDDLGRTDAARPIVAEGAALLPELVAPLLDQEREAIWIIPTEAFQRATYPQRGAWVQGILEQCTDPKTAFANWMARDIAFGQRVACDAQRLGLRVLRVDGSTSVQQNAQTVADWFAPHLPATVDRGNAP